MSNISIGEVVAERLFEVEDESGVKREVVLRIGKPIPDETEGGDWCCPYQILGLGNEKVATAFGVDSVQALLFGLQKAGMDLNWHQKVGKSKLTWLDEENLGFPHL